MALSPRLAVLSRNAALDAAFDTLNAGKYRVYDGSQPTDSDTALGAQVLLADLPLSATAFAAASGGSKVANAITTDASADATGTATWASFLTGANVRKFDHSAGTSGCNLNLNSAGISAGASVAVTSASVSMAA